MILPLILLLADASSAAERALPSEAGKTAAAVVRSKEWIIRRGENREEEFVGDVRYDGAGARLTADWALYRHAARAWQARGNVRLHKTLENGDRIEANGERAAHDEASLIGTLDPAPGGLVGFLRTPVSGEPDRGEGGRLSWEGDSVVTLSQGAHVWGPRLELWSDAARYERAGKRLVLAGGRPVLHKIEGEWTTALKADSIVATEEPRRIEASGKVKGWLIFKDPEKLKELAK